MAQAGMRTRLVVVARVIAACLAATLVVLLIVMWSQSLRPGAYAVADLASDHSGGHPQSGSTVSITAFNTEADRQADVVVELTARRETVQIGDGEPFEGYTLNGSTPGPTIRAAEGQLVEVRLKNQDVPGGVTLHWHGVDVPAAMDGVAGVTQDAVVPGDNFTYRFVAEQVGTFWYHSHQISHQQVIGGLFGVLILEPSEPDPVRDVVAAVHTYPDGIRSIGDAGAELHARAEPGEHVRVRFVNTDNAPLAMWSATPFLIRAIDGNEIIAPTVVTDQRVLVTAGARLDVEVVMPEAAGVRLQVPGATVVLGAAPASAPQPASTVDLLGYGEPTPLTFDPERPNRTFRYDIGRMPGFIDGKPGLWWSVNGRIGDDVPLFIVSAGDVVRVSITNASGEVHPMHLHGHHVLVLSHNGEPSTGSRWWVDSLNVEHGDTYEVVFVADNPGIWMDHCHNLPHAAEGLIAHVAYEGVSTPFLLGHDTGNEPE